MILAIPGLVIETIVYKAAKIKPEVHKKYERSNEVLENNSALFFKFT